MSVGGTKKQLPSLTGSSNKVRKSVAKSAAKYEPSIFRTSLIQQLETVDNTNDFDAYAKKLDELGNSLDFRKYEQELFQLLLVGRLIAPGGTPIQDEAPPCPFSLLTSASKDPADIAQVKQVVGVFNKLIRRYKYLQKDFEETSLPSILQHVNKFDGQAQSTAASGASTPIIKNAALPVPDSSTDSQPPSRVATPTPGIVLPASRSNLDKFAMATALFVTQGLAQPAVLTSIKKDHLVRDGSALAFLAVYLKTFLSSEPLDVLNASLRKGGVTDLLDFFPSNRRTLPEMTAFFKTHKLESVAELYQKQRGNEITKETLAHLKEMVSGTESNEEIITYLRMQERSKALSEVDFITLIWNGIISAVDLTGPNPTEAILKDLKELSPVLEAFCQNARTEVAMINTVQVWCYDHTEVMNAFVKILLTLFNDDVLSSQAILYWHSKGAKPQGKQQFLKASEALVKKLQEQEDEEEDDE